MSARYAYDMGRTFTVTNSGCKPPSSTWIETACPFCNLTFRIYRWSLAGGGKKCPTCGAMHTSVGIAYPVQPKEPKL